MYIIELMSNENKLAKVSELEKADFKRINVKRHLFNWKKLSDQYKIFKLTLIGDHDVLGLMALKDYPNEERTEIKLLTSSIENIGKEKRYDRIAGCLIGFAAKRALQKFARYPAVSLVLKTELKQHYINKYKMIDAGWQLYLEDSA